MASVTWNLGAVLSDLEQIGKQAPAALSRSLNRTATAVRTASQRAVREELNLKAGHVNKLMSVRRATAKHLESVIVIAGRPAPLLQFGARETRRGVSVKVKRKGARKTILKSFIETGRSGVRHVFTRFVRGGGASARLPIRPLFGTSVVQYLDDEKVLVKLHTLARTTFEKTLDHEIQHRLAKRAGTA